MNVLISSLINAVLTYYFSVQICDLPQLKVRIRIVTSDCNYAVWFYFWKNTKYILFNLTVSGASFIHCFVWFNSPVLFFCFVLLRNSSSSFFVTPTCFLRSASSDYPFKTFWCQMTTSMLLVRSLMVPAYLKRRNASRKFLSVLLWWMV